MADLQRVSLAEVIVHFQDLEDPRSTINQRHPLVSVLVIALLAVLAGASGPTAIARWAALKEETPAAQLGRPVWQRLERGKPNQPFPALKISHHCE